MKKSHFLILSLTITLMYWILDAYTNVSLYNTSPSDELFLKSTHILPAVKIITAFLIFTLTLIPLFYFKRGTKESAPLEEMDILQQVSELLFSSLSTKINIVKSLEKLEETFNLDSAILFLYHKDTLTLYHENTFIKTFFRTKELYPFRTNESISEVEKLAGTCFLEKREFSKDTLKLGDTRYVHFSFILKEEKSNKALGSLMLVCKNEKQLAKHLGTVQKIAQMFTFALSLVAKKETLAMINTQNTPENNSYDKMLGIMNNIKLQEHIDHEVNRYKRYHTELTLMIFEINTLKNLTNVFPSEVITNLKKDFIQIIKRNIRDTDVFSKWTNDQFALLLPDVDFRAGQGVAKKIQALLEDQKFTRVGKISCSFGITSVSPKDTAGTFRARCESALALANSREGNAIEVKLLV